MAGEREELHDELRAIMAARDELSPDADDHLVEVFLDRFQERYPVEQGRRKLRLARRLSWALRLTPRRAIAALGVALACTFIGVGATAALPHLEGVAQPQIFKEEMTRTYPDQRAFRKDLPRERQRGFQFEVVRLTGRSGGRSATAIYAECGNGQELVTCPQDMLRHSDVPFNG
ncbi:MAG: hypothetical protein ACRDFS_11200 [Chloroflexota bacterium]